MQPESLGTKRFEDAHEMATVLGDLARTAELAAHCERAPKPVLYVLGPDGTQFSTAQLLTETLSDGSRVYHIVLQA